MPKVESIEDAEPENELVMIFNRLGGHEPFQPYAGHRLDNSKSACGPDLPPFDHMSICECGIIITGRRAVQDESSSLCMEEVIPLPMLKLSGAVCALLCFKIWLRLAKHVLHGQRFIVKLQLP